MSTYTVGGYGSLANSSPYRTHRFHYGFSEKLATKALFTLFKERVPLDLKVRPALEQREGIQSTLRILGELGSMKSLSCREVDDYLNSSFRAGRKARGS